MKANEQLILKTAGLSDEDISNLEAVSDDQIDFDTTPYLDKINAAARTKLINDPTFYDGLTEENIPAKTRAKLEGGMYGRFMRELREVAVDELGLKEGEDFTAEDSKKLKVFAKTAAQKYASKHSTTEGAKELQDKLLTVLKEKETIEGSIEQKIADAVAGERNTTSSRMEKLIGIQKLTNIDGLKVKPAYVVDALLGSLRDKYAVIMDTNTMDFVLKQKANPELDVLDGTEVLTFDRALAKVAAADGLIEKKEPEVQRTGTVKASVSGDDVEISDYIKNKMGSDVD